MKKEELVAQISVPFFAHRETLDEAYEYFFKVAGAVNDADRAAMLTAAVVLLNTVANEINKLEV
jgi:hypothetical protein